METKFQTSFIPRKPLTATSGAAATMGITPSRPKRTGSIFLNLAIFLFLISGGFAGGLFAWKSILLTQQDNYKVDLKNRQDRFNPQLIAELKHTNVKIDTAKKLLSSHLTLSNIYGIISHFTVENIRFLNLELVPPGEQSNDIKITMSGQGTNLQAVAYQSTVLGSLAQYGLSNVVKNPIISNPSLDALGVVLFGFSATLDPTSFKYVQDSSGSANTTGGNGAANSANSGSSANGTSPSPTARPGGSFNQ